MMRFFTIFIIIFSITGTVWSMWLSNELKNEELKLKNIKNQIIDIDEKIKLVDAEWSFITNAKNLNLEIASEYLLEKLDNINSVLKEVN